MRIPEYILIHDVTIQKYLGHSAYGAQYGTAVKSKMRIEPKRKRVKDAQGTEYTSNAFAIVGPDVDIGDGYKVGHDGKEYTVKDWQPMSGNQGVHHIELVLV